MLATGSFLLITAQFAGASGQKGGIFRYGTVVGSVQVDPQLAYHTTAWWLEYATAAKLLNYPDKQGRPGTILQPEVASRYVVSNGGKRYTFFIRKGFRFSDGTPVQPYNFKYAILRALNYDLASPAAQFIADEDATEIVGARQCNQPRVVCEDLPGVRVKGNKLIVDLVRPDGTFLSKITMPFFQATSTKLPLDQEVVNVTSADDLPSAGPYTYTRNDVNTLTSIRRNSYWKRGPGRERPRNLDGVDIQWNLSEQTAWNQVVNNELDQAPIPATLFCELDCGFGPVNKSRFWVKPQNCTGYLALNMETDLFKGNLKLRQAINYAINRRAYVAQAGPYAGSPWTHLLNPGVPGWRKENPYPLNPDLGKARRLAAGQLRDGKIKVLYRSRGSTNQNQAQIVRQDLVNIGFERENITMVPWDSGISNYPMSIRGNPYNVGVSLGWCSEYPDPFAWINVLLYGGTIEAENNLNYSYMDLPKWNRRMEAAAKLVGPKRYKVYGQLDLDIMREVAPVAVERTYNNRYFFSNRVNPKSLVYQGIYQDFSIPAMGLK